MLHTWIARNVSFVRRKKYWRKLYELNERDVRNIEPYRRSIDSPHGADMVVKVNVAAPCTESLLTVQKSQGEVA